MKVQIPGSGGLEMRIPKQGCIEIIEKCSNYVLVFQEVEFLVSLIQIKDQTKVGGSTSPN